MDILFISKYFVVIALIIVMFAAVRAGAYKTTSMGLFSSSVAVVAIAMILLFIGDMFNIEFFKDITLALMIFGFVGTVAFAMTMGEDS